MLVKVNRASCPVDHSDFSPFEGAVFNWERGYWTLRVSTVDELWLLTRRLNETLLVELDGPAGLQLTVFDLFKSPPRPSEDPE